MPALLQNGMTNPWRKKNVGFAKLTIKNWGGIYTDAKDYKKQSIKILNTTRLNFSGKKLNITAECQVTGGSNTNICINMINRKITGNNESDTSCKIGKATSISIPSPIAANVCVNTLVTGKVGSRPSGKLNIKVPAKIGGNKIFNKTVLSQNF